MRRLIFLLFIAVFVFSSCSFNSSTPVSNTNYDYEMLSSDESLSSSDSLISGETYHKYNIDTKKEYFSKTEAVIPVLPTDELNDDLKYYISEFIEELDYPFEPKFVDFFFEDIYPSRTFTFYISDNSELFNGSKLFFSYNTSTNQITRLEDFLEQETIEQFFGNNLPKRVSKVSNDGIFAYADGKEIYVSSEYYKKESFTEAEAEKEQEEEKEEQTLIDEENFITEFHPDSYKPVTNSNEKYVALTFDDGPNPLTTLKLLDILSEKDVRATFFMVGYNIEEYTSTVKKVYDSGHDIGIHSYKHSNYDTMNGEDILSDLDKCSELINSIIGKEPYLVRPPFGNLDTEKIENDTYFFVNWNVDPLDWKTNSSQEIAQNALDAVRSGSIILLHDIYQASCEAAEIIIDSLKEEGYRFVTISEFYDLNGKKTDNKLHYFRGDFND